MLVVSNKIYSTALNESYLLKLFESVVKHFHDVLQELSIVQIHFVHRNFKLGCIVIGMGQTLYLRSFISVNTKNMRFFFFHLLHFI